MMRRASVAVLVCVVAFSMSSRAQSRRFITEKDLLKFTWVADPQISPDGSTVAFVRVTVNEKENRYETSIYAVPARGGEVRAADVGHPRHGPALVAGRKADRVRPRARHRVR